MVPVIIKAVRTHIKAVLSVKMGGAPRRFIGGIFPLLIPLDPDENYGFKMYHQFQGSTPQVEFLSCHVSVLVQGHSPHPPHTHSEEEILVMLAGEAMLILPQLESSGGTGELRLTQGQFVYYPADFPHTLRAVSPEPANYLMFKWRGPRRNPAELHYRRFDTADFYPICDHAGGFNSQRLFEGATECLGRLHAHVTTLAPGAGYEPHVDQHDAAIVIMQGEVETLGQRVGPHGILYFAAGEPHGIHNPGSREARYLVFEFARRVPFLHKVAYPQRWKNKLKGVWRR